MQTGDTFKGRHRSYRLTGPLPGAEGSYGSIWLAEDSAGHEVVVKLVRTGGAEPGSELWGRQFEAENAFLSSLPPSQKHVVRLLDQGRLEGRSPLVLERMQCDLRHWVGQLKQPPGLDRILDWCHQVSEGLAAVHAAGLHYRDLKLGDFGAVKPFIENPEHSYVGTERYMAPEQALPAWREPLDDGGTRYVYDTGERTDVFGLGLLFFWLVTGVAGLRSQRDIQALRDTGGEEAAWKAHGQLGGMNDGERALLRGRLVERLGTGGDETFVPGGAASSGLADLAERLCAFAESLLAAEPDARPSSTQEAAAEIGSLQEALPQTQSDLDNEIPSVVAASSPSEPPGPRVTQSPLGRGLAIGFFAAVALGLGAAAWRRFLAPPPVTSTLANADGHPAAIQDPERPPPPAIAAPEPWLPTHDPDPQAPSSGGTEHKPATISDAQGQPPSVMEPAPKHSKKPVEPSPSPLTASETPAQARLPSALPSRAPTKTLPAPSGESDAAVEKPGLARKKNRTDERPVAVSPKISQAPGPVSRPRSPGKELSQGRREPTRTNQPAPSSTAKVWTPTAVTQFELVDSLGKEYLGPTMHALHGGTYSMGRDDGPPDEAPPTPSPSDPLPCRRVRLLSETTGFFARPLPTLALTSKQIHLPRPRLFPGKTARPMCDG